MSKVIHVSQKEFELEVRQSDIPVVVDFYATWCPPCRRLGPILDRFAEEFDGQIKFVKIDSDEEQQLASDFNVTGLPTVLMMDHGQIVGQFAGLPQEADFRKQLNTLVASRKVAGQ